MSRVHKIENRDKSAWQETKWMGDHLTLKRPFRLCCCGSPGSGKTLFAWNVGLRRAHGHGAKPWSRVIVWSPHGDAGEWGPADVTDFRKELPPFDDTEYWGPMKEPCLLVCDDVMLTRGALRKDYENIDKVFSFCSTHHNWSIIVCAQVLSQIDLNFKRFMNCWALWKPRDLLASIRLASIVGLSKREMEALLDRLQGPHDCVMIDSTGTSGPGLVQLLVNADGVHKI